MNLARFHFLARKYREAEPGADGGGGDGGADAATVDRGDDFTATDDDATGGDTKIDDAKKDDPKKDDAKDDDKKDDDVKGDAKKDDDKDADKDDDDKKDDKKDGDKRTDTRVPLSRHKELLKAERSKREQAEAQLAKYQGGDKIAATNAEITKAEEDILKLEEDYNALVIDGKGKEASEKMRAIRAKERQISDSKVRMASEAATAQAVERVRYETTVERLETAYPQINPESDEFDEELSGDVVALMRTYVREHQLPPYQAIQRAVKRLCPAKTSEQTDATTVKARVSEEDAAKKLAEDRKAAQTRKNIDASKKQSPDISKTGADSDRAGGAVSAKDVMRMSFKDFSALDEKTLARMRGDEME